MTTHVDHRPYSASDDAYVHGIRLHTQITPHATASWSPPAPYPHLIKKIESFRLQPRWLFVRIETEGGVVGWGEATLEGHSEAVEGSLQDITRRLIGWDAMNIEEVHAYLYRHRFYRGGEVLMSAISGIDCALWDAKGKILGVPVWELLGGKVRDACEVYIHVVGDTVEEVRENARMRQKQGYKKVKMPALANVAWLDSPSLLEDTIARFTAVRELGLDVAIDFHGRLHRGMAKQLAKRLEPHQPYFIEEPLLPGHIAEFKELHDMTSIPLALGERLYTRLDVRPYLEASVVDILQPDLAHAGGITEVRKIATMAEAYDVGLAPHCPIGPLGLAACLHIGFCTPSFVIQEMILGRFQGDIDIYTYMKNPEALEVKDGYIKIFTRPGLGIEVNEEMVRREAGKGEPHRNPIVRGENSEIREW